MMMLEPYPGFEGEGFSMPARKVLPKPLQSPHPPLWMACTNRKTIKVAAENGIGALAFSFIDPDEAKAWADIYCGIIKSDTCVPLGRSVNANIAMVSAFSMHEDRAEAIRRGEGQFRVLPLLTTTASGRRLRTRLQQHVGRLPGKTR